MRRWALAAAFLAAFLAPLSARAQCFVGDAGFNDTGGFVCARYQQDILDRLPLSAAAYSLRKLRHAYSGAAVNIRRSSDNAKQDIGFDGQGNFNVAAFSAFVGGGTGFVVKEYDQSVNGIDAAQATNALQPKITLSATGRSRACVTFSGAQWLESSGTWTGTAAPQTLSAYSERTGTFTSVNNIMGTPGSPNNGTPALIYNSVASQAVLQGSSNLGATASDSAFHSLIGVINGSSSSLTVDGSTTAGSAGTIFTTGVVTIGAQSISHSDDLTGNICEAIGFNVGLTAGQISTLSGNQAAYY